MEADLVRVGIGEKSGTVKLVGGGCGGDSFRGVSMTRGAV